MTDTVRLHEIPKRDGWDGLTDVVTAYVSARIEPGGTDSPRDIVLYAIQGVRQREAERVAQLELECRGLHAQLQDARAALRFQREVWIKGEALMPQQLIVKAMAANPKITVPEMAALFQVDEADMGERLGLLGLLP